MIVGGRAVIMSGILGNRRVILNGTTGTTGRKFMEDPKRDWGVGYKKLRAEEGARMQGMS
jgi:hypothetical protein